MRLALALLGSIAALSVSAQQQEIQRALIERDQQYTLSLHDALPI